MAIGHAEVRGSSVYVFDEMMFNHNYNDSLTLFDMIKWYMDNHEMSEESRNYLIDFFFDGLDTGGIINAFYYFFLN